MLNVALLQRRFTFFGKDYTMGILRGSHRKKHTARQDKKPTRGLTSGFVKDPINDLPQKECIRKSV